MVAGKLKAFTAQEGRTGDAGDGDARDARQRRIEAGTRGHTTGYEMCAEKEGRR